MSKRCVVSAEGKLLTAVCEGAFPHVATSSFKKIFGQEQCQAVMNAVL